MSTKMLARSHFDHAREFLEAAQILLSLELFSAAASSAVSSAVHSERGIALASADDQKATHEISPVVPERRDVVSAGFEWLRELGPIAMRGPGSVTRAVAEQSVRQAELVYGAARSTLRF